jgi:hypothetical protein
MDEQTKDVLLKLVEKVEQANQAAEADPNEGAVIEEALKAGMALAEKVKQVVGPRPGRHIQSGLADPLKTTNPTSPKRRDPRDPKRGKR